MKYYNLFYLIIFIPIFFSCMDKSASSDPENDRKSILEVMNQQQKSWNEGNIDAFMVGYWNSDSLRFVRKNEIVYGYNKTLEGYKKRYSTGAEMGTLNFEVKFLDVSGDMGYMIGAWNLKRNPPLEDVGGHFSLCWKKINGEWVIISDHTS